MPVSEIDAIFSTKSKGKGKAVLQPPAPEALPVESSKKKRKKDKKRKRAEQEGDDKPTADAHTTLAPTPAPLTVIDPSIKIPAAKRAKQEKSTEVSVKKKSKKSTQEDSSFADSRGTGPRRKTEEGWSIYKEDELGIGNEGGGLLTSRSSHLARIYPTQIHHYARLIVIAVFNLLQYENEILIPPTLH